MEDFCLDIVIGKGPSARSVRLDLPPFTLVGATTRVGLLTAPLRDRFGVMSRLEYYTQEELADIVTRTADVFEVEIDQPSALEIARRSRGTPRVANRLLRRVRDFAQVLGDSRITEEISQDALERLQVDRLGLDHIDHKLLMGMIEKFNGGRWGLIRFQPRSAKNRIRLKMCTNRIFCKSVLSRERRGEGSSHRPFIIIFKWRLPDMTEFPKIIMILGAVLLIIGAFLHFVGKMPGDIFVKKEM